MFPAALKLEDGFFIHAGVNRAFYTSSTLETVTGG